MMPLCQPPRPPGYLSKHPCTGCGAGYCECGQWWVKGMQCCRFCDHPGRWQPDPWTEEDLAEMRAENERRAQR